tara:strand:- start:13521 stop:14138 length:618 start_codon:yes stop_codon:yes gene_type:complete
MLNINNRETWLNTAAAILLDELFSKLDMPVPNMRYSLTTPKVSNTGQVLGSCWNRAASSDGANEIFVTANLGEQDSVKILSTLVHEIVHAFDDNQNGHKAPFIKLCKLVGLKGGPAGKVQESFTATVATDELAEHLQEIVDTIGVIPHAAMNIEASGKKKQKNRNLKVKCNHCDFGFNTSQKNIDLMNNHNCLACSSGTLTKVEI